MKKTGQKKSENDPQMYVKVFKFTQNQRNAN